MPPAYHQSEIYAKGHRPDVRPGIPEEFERKVQGLESRDLM